MGDSTGSSTDQNIAFAQAFHEGVRHASPGANGLVKFSQQAWQNWDRAIQAFIDDIDTKINPKMSELRTISTSIGTLGSAYDTRTLLNDTAPDDIEASVKKYRDYLVELQKGLKTAYERLNDVDHG